MMAAQPIIAHSSCWECVMKFKADALIGFILCHSLAVLAFFPWFFSWTGVVLLAFGMFAFGILGINLGFHRLITHRGFTVPLWLEHTLRRPRHLLAAVLAGLVGGRASPAPPPCG